MKNPGSAGLPEDKTATMNNRRFAVLLASPILAPMALCAVVIFLLLIASGWFLVSSTFFVAAGAAAVGILGIVGALPNAANGIGAVLLMLGSGAFCLGVVAPLFGIAREFFLGYQALSVELMRKAVEVKEKVIGYVR